MSTLVLEKMYLHNNWANLALVEACSKLTDGQLDKEVEGTYGTIRSTLRHIASSQEGYTRRLDPTWQRPSIPEAADASFEDLRKSFEASGKRLMELAFETPPEAFFERTFGGDNYRIQSVIVLVQAIHHANDHRTQIATMITTNGVEPPQLDGWTYGYENGLMLKIDQ